MEFPAVGYRYYSGGSLSSAGVYGHYWSSVAGSSGGAFSLWFGSSDLGVTSGNRKRDGFSVRCVR
ncbi:MAG: fibrobacter succinogenes major paralogous domain-containing protein [Rikenellaceae bacterium]|nr:fibrobacter succinogenes major paralogous domain-containing protein [Rikenellaceae bacterium]